MTVRVRLKVTIMVAAYSNSIVCVAVRLSFTVNARVSDCTSVLAHASEMRTNSKRRHLSFSE